MCRGPGAGEAAVPEHLRGARCQVVREVEARGYEVAGQTGRLGWGLGARGRVYLKRLMSRMQTQISRTLTHQMTSSQNRQILSVSYEHKDSFI